MMLVHDFTLQMRGSPGRAAVAVCVTINFSAVVAERVPNLPSPLLRAVIATNSIRDGTLDHLQNRKQAANSALLSFQMIPAPVILAAA